MTLGHSGGPLDVCLTAMGVPVVVRCSGSRASELRHLVVDAWQDCLSAGSAADDDPVLVDVALEDADQAALVLHELSPRMTSEVIGRNAGELLMLHAAGLADPDSGRAVALVAASGTGKTTATRRLGRELGYLSDETVAIRADRSVVAYPKPLSVLESPDSAVKTQTAASALGLLPAPARSRLCAVLLLSRDSSAAGVDVKPVPTLEALALLAPQISYLARLPRPLHRVAETLAAVGGLCRVTYREADELGPVVHRLLREDTA
jgi:hypothetical protein